MEQGPRKTNSGLTRFARVVVMLAVSATALVATGTASPAASGDVDLYPAKALDPTDQNGAQFGASTESAGDLNGDGFDDMIAGAANWDGEQPNEGRAYVYLGSATGLQANPTTLDPTDQNGANFGNSVSSAGDINSDGYDDVIVGAWLWDGEQANEGRAYVYLGSASGLQANPTTVDPTNQLDGTFGVSVGTAGDINSDGNDDVIVGAHRWDGEQIDEGRAYIYLGSTSGLQASPILLDPTDQSAAEFGLSVGSSGDVNSDGYDDVIVGAWFWDGEQINEGRAYLYLGSSSGLQASPTTLDPTDQLGAQFGNSVGSGGDVNSDGYDDVVVGANSWDGQQTGEGRVFVYLGSASGLQANPTTLDPTDQLNANFGNSVESGGDINSDGYDDVVVGAHLWDGQLVNEGRVYIYFGSATGPQANPTTLDPTDHAGANFGFSVGSGDVNSDGYDDVVVGAHLWNGEQTDEGRVYLIMRRIAPVFAGRSDKTVHEAEALSFRVRARDANGDSLTYSATGLPTGATFSPGTREFSWTPAYNQSGNYEVTFTVTDGVLTDEQTIGITVLNTNRPPELDPIGNKTVVVSNNLFFEILAADPDADVKVTYSAPLLPPGATFNPGTQEFSWTPTSNQVGTYLATFEASDGDLSDTQSIYITVEPAPKATPALTLSVAKARKAITASGKLTPPHESAEVLVTLSRKVSGVFKKIVTNRDALDDTGAYVTSFKRPAAGSCKIRSFFPGDEDHTSIGVTKNFKC